MTAAESPLWKKRHRFPFNDPGIDLSFAQTLAQENGRSTRAIYQPTFPSTLPADTRHPHQQRFPDIGFQRVKLRQYWLLKKPSHWTKRLLLLSGIGLFASWCIQGTHAAGIIIAIVVVALIFWLFDAKSNPEKRKGKNNSSCFSVGGGVREGVVALWDSGWGVDA